MIDKPELFSDSKGNRNIIGMFGISFDIGCSMLDVHFLIHPVNVYKIT